MSKHTGGPVRVGDPPYTSNFILGVDRADGMSQTIAEVFGYSGEERDANLRWIAAAWNAAEEAGLSTEALESGVVRKALIALKTQKARQVRYQRAQARATKDERARGW